MNNSVYVCFCIIDYFIQFGESLGKVVGDLEKMWDQELLGRYDRAVESLVADVLQESQIPVEKVVNAVKEMKTPESAKRTIQAVHKGK